jgi:hypothetical protein
MSSNEELYEKCDKLYTSSDKWYVAIILGFIFMILSLPILDNLVDNYLLRIFMKTLLFILIIRILLQ